LTRLNESGYAVAVAPRRIAELDGLRAFAILGVFLYHTFNVPLFWMGVDLFFVLSGFLITGVLLDSKQSGKAYFRHFYSRRARRILAPYILVMLISSLLFGTQWAQQWYWYVFFGTNIGNALQAPGHESLVPLWSLAVEEQFYLLWPLLVFVCSARVLARIAAGLLLLAPILRALATPLFSTHFPIYYLTPFRMDLLGSGALLAVLWRTDGRLFKNFEALAWFLATAAVSLLVWFGRYPNFRTGSNTVVANVFIYSLVTVLATSLVVIALIGKGPICQVLRSPPLRWIGKISYSMYLIHMTIIVLTRQVLGSSVFFFPVSLTMTILFAATTWYGFEMRLLSPARPVEVLAQGASGT
jgi:peptidoglycan/LPS O-acetylase OafA/YrhL